MATDDIASFEPILEALGMPGRFQLTQLILTLISKFIVTFMALSYVFLGYDPPHSCNPINETRVFLEHGIVNDSTTKVKYGSCDILISTNHSGSNHDVTKISCPNGRNFPNGEDTTFVSEWDLVCENRGIAEWTQTLFILGQIVGGLVNSGISDRFGRKPVYVFSIMAVFVLESAVLLAPNIYVIYVLKLLSGFSFQGVLTSYIVHNMEILVPRHRQIYGVIICYMWVFSVLLMGGIAYFLRNQNWRFLQGVIAGSGVFCVAFPFLFYESPRWLATNGKLEEALAVLRKACHQNGKDFEHIKSMTIEFVQRNCSSSSSKSLALINIGDETASGGEGQVEEFGSQQRVVGKKQSMITLFRNKQLLGITLIAWYTWVTGNLTYYGLYMTSSSIAGDRFLNYTLMALVEVPSNAVILLMLNRMKRRLVLVIFLALSAVSLVISTLLITFAEDTPNSGYISTALFIFGKFAITCAFNTIFIITPELFPTNLRSTGTGFCNSFGRIGSMIAPYFRPLFKIAKWAPGLIFTVMCAIAVCLIPFLPETKDKSLPNNIDDIKREQEKKERFL